MTGTVIDARAIFGMKALDDEHQAIAGHIQKLATTLEQAAYSPTATETALIELIDCLKAHFRHEESWMQDMNYPGFRAHKRQHEKQVEVVMEFLADFKAQPIRSQGETIHGFISEWLSDHTLHSDRLAARYARHRRRS